jgi:acetylornithine deacetylase/succinyl-diaminopimelate desuccinylase-like protein
VHTSEEWVDLRSLEDCVAVFEETVRRFCGAGT